MQAPETYNHDDGVLNSMRERDVFSSMPSLNAIGPGGIPTAVTAGGGQGQGGKGPGGGPLNVGGLINDIMAQVTHNYKKNTHNQGLRQVFLSSVLGPLRLAQYT